VDRRALVLPAAAAAALLLTAPSALAAAPANDNFANAVAITGAGGSIAGTNVDATAELGEPAHAGDGPNASVWYRWSAPASGTTTIDLCGSDFDTLLAVYTGSTVGSLTAVASNDDSLDSACGYGSSRVTFDAVAGTAYSIAVDGFNGDTGSFQLHWAPPRPTNLTRPAVSGRPEEGETLSVGTGDWQTQLPATYGYRWQRCGRLDFPAANVALHRPVAVSAFEADHPPENAVDGDFYSYWGAGNFPPQWIEVDLGAPYPLNKVRLAITQLPDGATDHRVVVKGPQPGATYQVLGRFTGNTVDQQVLEWNGGGSWVDDVQFIRVETLSSISWVGWREVEAYTNCLDVAGANASSYTVTHADIGYMLRALVTATTAAGSTVAASSRTAVVPYLPPQNTAAPVVSGVAALHQTLHASPGDWRGTAPLSLTYQWQRCADPAGITCADVAGRTSPDYAVGDADVGLSVRVVVTAANAAGSAAAASAATQPVPPVCRVPGVIGRALAWATGALARAHCRLGAVGRAYSRRVRKGRVIAQNPRAGVERPAGSRVSVVISRGRHRRA
jgi:hypothetical protein